MARKTDNSLQMSFGAMTETETPPPPPATAKDEKPPPAKTGEKQTRAAPAAPIAAPSKPPEPSPDKPAENPATESAQPEAAPPVEEQQTEPQLTPPPSPDTEPAAENEKEAEAQKQRERPDKIKGGEKPSAGQAKKGKKAAPIRTAAGMKGKRTSNRADGVRIANEMAGKLQAGPATLTLDDTQTADGWVSQDCIEALARTLTEANLLDKLTVRPNRPETAATVRYVTALTGLEIRIEGDESNEREEASEEA